MRTTRVAFAAERGEHWEGRDSEGFFMPLLCKRLIIVSHNKKKKKGEGIEKVF